MRKTLKAVNLKSSKQTWFNYDVADVIKLLEANIEGLSAADVTNKQKTYGKNILPVKRQPTVFEVFLHQFLNPLIYILIAASIVAFVMHEITDAMFILGVILLNASLGTYQEWKAEKTAHQLQQLLKVIIRVKRDGIESEISSDELVPGDIVLIESGQKVPADIRLMHTNNLNVDESFLTGESVSVGKHTDLVEGKAGISAQKNMVFAGSTVMSGRGTGIVVETAMNTEVGKIADSILFAEGSKPPLVIRMEKFSRQISYFVLGAVILLAIVAISKGMDYREVFFLAVALAVSAIPEGLPIAITVALSIGTKRMANRNVIVRKLAAVESLGSCTMIASDKTGTLTVNRQTLKKILLPFGELIEVTGEGYEPNGQILDAVGRELSEGSKIYVSKIAEAVCICNEASLRNEQGQWKYQGDAIDIALLSFGYKAGIDYRELKQRLVITSEIPFESERRFAATKYSLKGESKVAVKGAVERVIDFCDTMIVSHGTIALEKDLIQKMALAMSENGYRVLAIASGVVPEQELHTELIENKISGLTLLAIVCFIDPLRQESKDAIEQAKMAGIEVAMITGDHPATALAIARELGIASTYDDLLTGQQIEELEAIGHNELKNRLNKIRVFARVTPMQKLKIVETMLELGHFVAVTGDGVNDAPALKKANIGVAMGSGTDVARDTASILVVDDNFSSIVKGIEEGRYAYSNVRKVIYLLISTGTAEIVLFTLALFAGLPLPLLAVQLLWLNLVTNGIQDVALAFEGGEPGTMRKPPRKPGEGVFDNLMLKQTAISGFTIGTLAFGTWFYLNSIGYDQASARNVVLLLMVLLENVHVFNCRSEYVSAFKVPIKRNYLLIGGVVAAQGIHILSMNIPIMQTILNTSPVTLKTWMLLVSISSVLLIVMEMFKRINRRSDFKSAN